MTYGLLWSTGEHGEDDDGDDEHNDDDDDDTHECRWTICPDSTDAREPLCIDSSKILPVLTSIIISRLKVHGPSQIRSK